LPEILNATVEKEKNIRIELSRLIGFCLKKKRFVYYGKQISFLFRLPHWKSDDAKRSEFFFHESF